MGTIKEISDKLMSGAETIRTTHPLLPTGESEEVADGVAYFRWFANVVAVKTEDGLVLVDTGAYFNQEATLAMLRRYSPDRIGTAIYTHGHVDHVGGMPAIVAEAQRNHVARPKVVGNRLVAPRFDRYKRTTGYQNVINSRQFSIKSSFPSDYVYPDTYYDNQLNVVAGTRHFECHHGRGETDDATWVYIPERKVLCAGDFFIWCAPNAGNPQKVQRYAKDWADALRAMAKTGATVLCPGHGLPIFGLVNVRQALNETADYLQSLSDQTTKLMNEGATLDDIIHTVKPPAALVDRPYLQPVYDEPEFVVRNIWRLDGGWYDGIPSHLKPAREADQAREIAALAGGVDRVVARANEKLAAGELELACHLIDWAAFAAPDDQAVHAARAKIYGARTAQSSSTMSIGIFGSAARESAEKAGIPPPQTRRVF
jgi:alkyl sulfatase BDS1-like metallo-beta-lactamase superfamily hydrolase